MRLLELVTRGLLAPRAHTCRYIQAHSGDGCWSLAQSCGISQDDLEKYNPVSDFCNTITDEQYVCCSEGDLPDFSPQQNQDGSCFAYMVRTNDTCAAIAKANQMETDKISKVNNDTWGWGGCQQLHVGVGQKICLSYGTPPFPAPVVGTVCGPQVPGTEQPTNMTAREWGDLNPCPLNACCDVWGQCGITPEFCTETPADTGSPGTAKPNTNGCISNCGTSIKDHGGLPTEIKRIGYFEAWNLERPCLNMDVSKVTDGGYYTHVHFAFANITNDWQVDVSSIQDQFDGLLKLKGIKRILSFGGWAFSTDSSTYQIFGNGVKDGNRQSLAKNVVDFVVDNDLEGIDFDWEYPGAQDIRPLPADSLESGANYLEFLRLVRELLPSDKSLSIAAPASYWYLKAFPIDKIAGVVDYLVFMTYDLHGQWDCPDGNCLRSHVNKTETEYALAMITKAGVPAKQIIPALALYGRSFQMSEVGCKKTDCTFTDPQSGTTKGECTDTAGYISNVEINNIIGKANNPDLYGEYKIEQYEDEGDVLIYDDTQWVSYLSPPRYLERRQWIDDMGFGGTADWAMDLNKTYTNNGTGDPVEVTTGDEAYQVCDYSRTFDSTDDLHDAAGNLRTDCIAVYSLQVLRDMLDKACDNYTDVNDGYDKEFSYYVTYINKLVPSTLKNNFMWNMSTTLDTQVVPDLGYGMNFFECQLDSGYKGPCSELGDGLHIDDSVTTRLSLVDEDGYHAALFKAGLTPDWVELGDYEIIRKIDTGMGNVPYVHTLRFKGFPIKNKSIVVSNPKDIVTKGLASIPDLRSDIEATMLDMTLGAWDGAALTDAAQAYSIPVFMLLQAINGMAEAKKLGEKEEQEEEEEEEERNKNFILLIVSVVLMFVPVVGEEVAVAAGLVTLGRAIAITGELGNAALAIYDTVQDPGSAIVNILGMLVGVGSIAKVARDGEGIASAAKIRAGMKAEDIATLGTIFKENDDKLQSILKVCRR